MRRRSRTKAFLVVLALLLVLIGSVSYLAWRQSVPGVRVSATPPRALGHKTAFPVVIEATRGNVTSAEVRLVQGSKTVVVAQDQDANVPSVQLAATIEPAATGIGEGAASLEVWARDDFWRPFRRRPRAAATFAVTVDLTPPTLEVVAATPYVAPGGAGVVVVRARDASQTETRVGALTFPTFAVGAQGTRVGLFALPWDVAKGTPLSIVARDEAGNTTTRPIPGEMLPRRFRRDTIELTERFLETKVPELLPQRAPSQPLIEGFLVINRDQRRWAEEEKRRLAAQTADKLLWEGAFVQPRNTKVFSNFAESRTYRYNGREVDTQVHFGYDLASTKQAPVPAANSGVVAFAGPLTIYGNTIVLDHGLGLMTLYAHLSSIAVKAGESVAKDQEIGRTGTTGLASGDHLHYEVLVHGISVTPLEWWDANWIRDRIDGPLRTAGLAGVPGL